MAEKDEILKTNWPLFRESIRPKLSVHSNYTSILYDLQMWTNLLFDYAFRRHDLAILDQLSVLYQIPFAHLRQLDTYWYYNGDTANPRKGYIQLPLPASSPMWVKEITMGQGTILLETILHSSQFLYLIAHAIHCLVTLDPDQRTTNMNSFIEKCTPIVFAHYSRWIFQSNGSTDLNNSLGIFQVKGWGCYNGRFNHREFLEKKLHNQFQSTPTKTFCNAICDDDMWILCGAVELLAAQKINTDLFVLDATQEAKFREYFTIGCQLIESRLKPTALTDFNGNSCQGINVDPGVWKTHPDWRYAGYAGSQFPETDPAHPGVPIDPQQYPVPETISFDISHARRYVQVFDTLFHNRPITGQLFPSREIMEGLANQIAYGVFNRDFQKPLFTNFFDSTNGWFRVNYSNRTGFGYAPWDNSIEWISGGMASWYQYQPDLKKVNDAVWNMIYSEDPTIKTFRIAHYIKSYYENGVRVGRDVFNPAIQIYIINFITASEMPPLPTLEAELFINRPKLNFGIKKGDNRSYSQTITVANHKNTPMTWNAACNTNWLTCLPVAGLHSEDVSLTVTPGSLPAGLFSSTVTFSSKEAVNPPQILTVGFSVLPSDANIELLGYLDTPQNNQTVSGSVTVTG